MKVRRIILFTLIAIMLIMPFGTVQATGTVISVESVTAQNGVARVPICISGNTGICGATISVSYDKGMTLTGVAQGSALSTLTMTKPGDMNANPVNLVWDGVEADSTDGVIAYLIFNLSGNGTYEVGLSYEDGDIVDGDLNPVSIEMSDGVVSGSGSSGNDNEQNPDEEPDITGKPVIRADSLSGKPGEAVTVPIILSGNTGICGATISVSYDKGMKLTGVAQGSALSTLAMTKPGDMNANPVNLVWDGVEADSTDGVIAYLTFNLPDTPGAYSINLSYEDGDIVDGKLLPINIIMSGGEITSGAFDSITVQIGGKTATLASGRQIAGRVIVGMFDSDNKLISAKAQAVTADTLTFAATSRTAYAKVLWCESMASLKPVCKAQIINLK